MEKYKSILDELAILYDKQDGLTDNLKNMYSEIQNNQKKIKHLLKKLPICYSCMKNINPKYMNIATQKDLDNYKDQEEGYRGPKIGEYYCGC